MQHDPKLVEAVEKILHWYNTTEDHSDVAIEILNAINASGIHWVEPWEATCDMDDAGRSHGEHIGGWAFWQRMRNAYLNPACEVRG